MSTRNSSSNSLHKNFTCYMSEAISAARTGGMHNEVPVGAVIVYNHPLHPNSSLIVASSHNLVVTNHDPTAHAEIIAIRSATAAMRHNSPYFSTSDASQQTVLNTLHAEWSTDKFLQNCDIYVTLEPCAMCAHAISLSRIRRLYFGALDFKGGAVENGPRLYHQPGLNHKPEVYGGIMAEACGNILQQFFIDIRAQTKNSQL